MIALLFPSGNFVIFVGELASYEEKDDDKWEYTYRYTISES